MGAYCGLVDVSEEYLSDDLAVMTNFPNPASASNGFEVLVNIPTGYVSGLSIRLFDFQGRLISIKDVTHSKEQIHFDIDSYLPWGTYLIVLLKDGIYVSSKKQIMVED